MRYFQWVSQANDHPQLRQKRPPEGQGDAVARVLPPPGLERPEHMDERRSAVTNCIQARIAGPVRAEVERMVPTSAELVQYEVIYLDKAAILPESLGIVGCRL